MRTQKRPGLRERLRFHNWPIATKLLIVSLGLAIIPLLIAIAITGSVSSEALTRQTRISLSRLSYSVAQRITQTLTDKQGLLQVAAGDPTVAELLTAPSPERARRCKKAGSRRSRTCSQHRRPLMWWGSTIQPAQRWRTAIRESWGGISRHETS